MQKAGLNGWEMFVPEGVEEIAPGAFAGMKNLRRVQLPKTLRRIGAAAFYGCGNLAQIALPAGLVELGTAAFKNSGLQEISIPPRVARLGGEVFADSALRCAEIKGRQTGESMFRGCCQLAKVQLSGNIRKIEAGMFRDCAALKTLRLPEKLEQVLAQADQIQQIARDFAGRDDVFFIGRNLDYALSMEGSLKLKEISYIHSEAYASGELKHGTISLIEEGTPVIALSTYGPLFDKAMSNVVEVQARGANVLALTTETHRDAMAARTPRVLTVPDVEPMLLPQLGVAPLQLLAYYIALERGCDIDKPRNLAKSVTVE